MRDKLIELLDETFEKQYDRNLVIAARPTADYLISHGLTFAKDNNVPCKKPMTNGDIIRSMTDEELAEFNNFCPHIDEECTRKGCIACVLEWLKQPAEVET